MRRINLVLLFTIVLILSACSSQRNANGGAQSADTPEATIVGMWKNAEEGFYFTFFPGDKVLIHANRGTYKLISEDTIEFNFRDLGTEYVVLSEVSVTDSRDKMLLTTQDTPFAEWSNTLVFEKVRNVPIIDDLEKEIEGKWKEINLVDGSSTGYELQFRDGIALETSPHREEQESYSYEIIGDNIVLSVQADSIAVPILYIGDIMWIGDVDDPDGTYYERLK